MGGLKLVLILMLSAFAASGKGKDVAPTTRATHTLYEYFTEGGITKGLEANDREFFYLNGKQLKIFGGSLHYFRVHPDYWRDRLRKFRAAGLNTIDIYVPWNLHEPERGVFDFGTGGRDMSLFLDLPRFIEMCMEEDLFVIFRPGPYICAEWEFGGLPSWLLSEQPMYVRSSQASYQDRANIFIAEVVSRVKHQQFYTAAGSTGGPIIMTQIENEFGAFGYEDFPRDKSYLRSLKNTFESSGIETILFTSDSQYIYNDWGNVDKVYMTTNFKDQSIENMDRLLQFQPNKPILVTEYWPGWFDHWFAPFHNIFSLENFTTVLQNIFDYKGSVNFYMFHGGTNFGFMNGGNIVKTGNDLTFPNYAPTVTSYDYDAPLTESGQYTVKYDRAAEMIAAYDPLASTIIKPERPAITEATVYASVQMTEYLNYNRLMANVPGSHRVTSDKILPMEQLPINNGNGQSYGYVVYRTRRTLLSEGSKILVRGHARDLLQLIVNGVMINNPILKMTDLSEFGSWAPSNAEFTIDLSAVPSCADSPCNIDLFVENLGRANFGKPHEFDQRKGLTEEVYIDGEEITDWQIFALEFKSDWVQGLVGWQEYNRDENLEYAPRVLRGSMTISGTPQDTYFDFNCEGKCSEWLHGAMFVNGFNIGRYFNPGPTRTLFIPAPFLKEGDNQIIIMENYLGSDTVQFTATPILGTPRDSKDVIGLQA